jgi:hypothetical protein
MEEKQPCHLPTKNQIGPLDKVSKMIIDGETAITGSFNFTKGAEEKNAENLFIIHDKKLAKRYT